MAYNDWGITSSINNPIARVSTFNIINSIIWNSPIHLSSNDDDYQYLQVSYSNYGSDGDYESGDTGWRHPFAGTWKVTDYCVYESANCDSNCNKSLV